MQLPSRIPQKLGPRVDFRPEQFRKFILQAGLQVQWEQAQECPCKRKGNELDLALSVPTGSRTAESRIDCEMCKGKGYFHHSAQTIIAVVTSSRENPDRFRIYGEYADGMIGLSLLPEHLPAWGDRFTLLDSVLLFRETRVRGAGAIESLRFPIVSRLLDLAGGSTSVDVLQVHRGNADGTADQAGELDQDVDFEVTPGGDVDFTLGDVAQTAPVEGSRYAVSYYAHPRYMVVDHPHAFRDTFIKTKQVDPTFAPLPVQCDARLEFLSRENE